MEMLECAYSIFVRRSERKRLLGRLGINGRRMLKLILKEEILCEP
jgi:hypothetical protein